MKQVQQHNAVARQYSRPILCKVTSSPTLAATSQTIAKHVVWLRHIDWHLPATSVVTTVEQALEVQQLHERVQHLDVPAAAAGGISKQQHKGYALISFSDEDAAQQAMVLLAQLPLGKGSQAVQACLAPAAVLPASWPEHARMTQHDYQAEQLRQQQLVTERAKLRRQRVRKREQYVAGLAELLDAIPAPGGLQALDSAYSVLSDITTAASAADPPDRDYGKEDSAADACPTTTGATSVSVQPASRAQIAMEKSSGTQALGTSVVLDWGSIPDACQVTVRSIKGNEQVPLRVQRKRAAVESFAQALSMLLRVSGHSHSHTACGTGPHSHSLPVSQHGTDGGRTAQQQFLAHIVEFGSGSGNLVLPLAWLFPDLHFHAVDCKAASVQLLLQRAQAAGLKNLTAEVGLIENFSGRLDVALGLHACGSATDYAMLQAAAARAAYIISPCCVGKINTAAAVQHPIGLQNTAVQNTADAPQLMQVTRLLSHPRSKWLRSHLPAPAHDAFQQLAQAADISESDSHGHEQLARLAKTHVELDRNKAMQEAGYMTVLTRLLQPGLHEFKSDLLLGVPKEAAGVRFGWPKDLQLCQ